MKKLFLLLCLSFPGIGAFAVSTVQPMPLSSPNGEIVVQVNAPASQTDCWGLTVRYKNTLTALPAVKLGLLREDADFAHGLDLKGFGKVRAVHEEYTVVHGKRSICINDANELTLRFVNSAKKELDVVIRAYNNGLAFRYVFPEKTPGKFKMTDELTSYQISDSAKRWMQSFVPSYEGFYPEQDNASKTGEWGYPALVESPGAAHCWSLITEAGLDRNYCATKLSNTGAAPSAYKITYPSAADGNYTGDVEPVISLPWHSPWRVVIIGQLSDVVSSTLVEDVSDPSQGDYSWVKPGISSWVYWAYNHGTKDYQRLCQYTDLAARMGWTYTLFDWEWNQMGNGGDVQKAAQYANSKGVKPLLWYNSGGPHNTVSAEPRDRLLTAESRAKEFAWLKKTGFYGVKVDFFGSDKQNIINYYIDLMEDAAKYKLMIYFHGSTVPRGWSRTYPNLITVEAVNGAEQYNNGPVMTYEAARHNATLPFTRNVVGPMDYTPVTFTNSQHPHITTFAHELALPVIFESGIQHMADRPEAFDNLPYAEKLFLTRLPASWDDTHLVTGYPGKSVIMARRKGEHWFLGGINGENVGGETEVDFGFLPPGKKYKLTLMTDGDHDTAFKEQYVVVTQNDKIQVQWLPRGGFAGYLEEF